LYYDPSDNISFERYSIVSHTILPEPFVCSDDFRSIMDMSLRKVAHVVIEDLGAQVGAAIPPSGLPLAKLLARVAQLSSTLLEEPSKNKHIKTIRSMPEVELFYTFLYANMPPQI
jgi:peroxin-3